MRRRRCPVVTRALPLLLLGVVRPISAQTVRTTPAASSTATPVAVPAVQRTRPVVATVDPLDAWVVTRFRGAHLLVDSAVTLTSLASLASNGPLPRVESARAGRDSDTLLAVHFSARRDAPMMQILSRARLVGANGTIVPVTVRVLQRRLFRAPRVPAAKVDVESQWRYGWAYLVVLPHDNDRPAGRYRSWLLLPTTSP
ncbi:hypothetical protein [Gemmatimonas aurantiaca]|uniref:hypothetical protein n=1 Tax=Gemmatimonas aurantiaca TaxID=173480 RepID=UPI0012EA23AE|nr:hypothetical protein [Gemmatimonas aurantiaca]